MRRKQFYTPPELCSLGTVDPDLQIFASHVRLDELDVICVCAVANLMCKSCGENSNFAALY